MKRRRLAVTVAAAVALGDAGCAPPPADPLPADSFAFAVFGDGPYSWWEEGRWERVLADLARTDVAWLLHIGDLYVPPCTDAKLAARARELADVPYPVVYTPGDNEWTDCHAGGDPGIDDPLERLAALRRVFFVDPGRSTGAIRMPLETQAADPSFAEFGEHARWRKGGFVFATVHLVGSGNGAEPFRGRTSASDVELERRTRAALAWTAQTFDTARATGAKGVVIAFHAEVGLDPREPRDQHRPFVEELKRHVAAFPGEVIAIHGDSHDQRVDHPLADSAGRSYANFTRIETFGSPDIGWLRVVVDTVAGRVVRVEPRRMRGWW